MRVRGTGLLRSEAGAVAPTVALSLFGLIAAGGLAFDYARLASLDTELQQAADHAALAAASQLDGETGACARAAQAASAMVVNETRFANDGQGIRSEEHTSELQSLMRISYAVFCLKKKKQEVKNNTYTCTALTQNK